MSRSSIEAAEKTLRAYAEGLPERVDRGVGEAMADAQGTAEAWLSSWPQPYATGDLASHFELDHGEGTWTLANDSGHAAFFEFGTGVKGARSPYGAYGYGQPDGWSYDVNGHGDAGWLYRDKDGELHWTKGLAARPFMGPTALYLRQVLVPTVEKEVRRG